jgi:curli biogenesis system outer membrane secretion channel CsgG
MEKITQFISILVLIQFCCLYAQNTTTIIGVDGKTYTVIEQESDTDEQPANASDQPSVPEPVQIAAPTLGGKPKIAVYVSEHSGYSQEQKSALRTATLNVLVRSGWFEVIERSNVIDKELSKQASGDVDDDQLVRFGRQAGARYVCVSDMISPFGSYRVPAQHDSQGRQISPAHSVHPYQVSARIINVETAEVVALGVIDYDIQSGSDMSVAVSEAVTTMLETMPNKSNPNMPKIAVYIQGGGRSNDKVSNALYTYVLNALFTRSRYNGDFMVVERSEAFTKQIDKEHGKQRSGDVDNSQISRMGKQYGIERICVASIERAMNTYNISARLINVESASVLDASLLRHLSGKGEDLSRLRNIAVLMVEDMIERQKSETELEEERQELEVEREIERTAYMMGTSIGGGVSLNMNEVDPNFFKSLGGQFSMTLEFYRSHIKFFRYGLGFDLGGVGIDRDAVRKEYLNIISDSITTFNAKVNGFLRLYPAVDFLFLSGGVGWAWYNAWGYEATGSRSKPDEVTLTSISTPVFPVGGGIIIGPNGNGVLIEVLYNIVPFQGRTASYLSINAGFKGSLKLKEERKTKKAII